MSLREVADALGFASHSALMQAIRRERARRWAAKASGVAESSATFQNAPAHQTGSTAAKGKA